MKQDMIVILDLGSTENTVLAREIRALGVYSEIHPHDITAEELKNLENVKGIILNGGENRVVDGKEVEVRPELYDLGYPMISVDYPASKCSVQLSRLPDTDTLKNFIFQDCRAEANWNMKNFIEDQVELIRNQVGDRKVLLALSGGVDSSVVAAMLIKAIGQQLVCVHVNHGLMRKNESESVVKVFRDELHANLIYVDASERFLGKLENVADPEEKRKIIGGEFIRDIEPGEIVTITRDGVFSDKSLQQEKRAHCVFEYIYFARLDSHIDDVSVYEARLRGGAALAHSFPADADLVAGVPDSGLTAAMGYAKASGIPYEIIFHKNSYVGRTFIKPTQEERENSVRIKLNILEPAVRGKRIVLVDDSIVRGTTMKNLIRMLKKAGAKEVHVRVSSPPFLFPCYFGTDVPSNKQLIASSHSVEEICREIGADSLGYMPVEDLEEMAGGLPLCTACFTGNYPMDVPDGEIKDALE